MVRVAPISLAYNPRTLWFDPGELELEPNAAVVVETARGKELGRMTGACIEVSDEEIKALKSPLKPVVRVADEEDIAQAAEMEERSREALPVFREMAAEMNEDMRPVSVEFLLDGDKAVFYFEAEERVDFRELVRKLASHFHVRIDMRQIGVRDEARMIGGLGHCGQELCCSRMGGEFCPVSIRMAKEQDLSLNPQKISGRCGRLMCCLRYEYEAYKDFKQRAPKVGAKISTPDGEAVVTDLDVPRETVKLRIEGEKPVSVPLSDFEKVGEGESARPNAVDAEAWEMAKCEAEGALIESTLTFVTSQFTGSDKVAKGSRARRIDGEDTEKGSRSSRRRKSRGGSDRSSAQESAAAPARKPRRRRSTKIADGEVMGTAKASGQNEGAAKEASEQGSSESSGRSRRRRRSSSGGGSQGGGNQKRTSQEKASGSQQRSRSEGGPRPGQRSSGLRNNDERSGSGKSRRSSGRNDRNAQAKSERNASNGGAAASSNGEGGGQRRRRRRSCKPNGSGGGASGAAGSSGSAGASKGGA